MATLYGKAAGGNWSAAATWSNVSSAGGDSSGPPTAADDVILDSGSGAITIDSGGTRVCRSLNCTGYTNTLTHAASTTLNIGDGTAGASNIALKLVAGMTYTPPATATLGFISTNATQQTVDAGGKTLPLVVINGASSSYQFAGSFSCVSWTYTAGTTLDMTTNTVTITITVSGTFAGGGKTYYGLTMAVVGSAFTITGSNTFTNLNRTGTAVTTDSLVLSANQTISGTFTLAGNAAALRLTVRSDIRGTQRTITNTGATQTWSYVDIEDIALTTSFNASAITGLSGDLGGNSNITFTTPVNLYWFTSTTGTKAWPTVGFWFLATGGTGGAGRVPLPQDFAIFDANSIGAASTIIGMSYPRFPATNFTGVTNNPQLSFVTGCSFFGSLILTSGVSIQAAGQAINFITHGNAVLTSGGNTFDQALNFYAPGGSWTLTDNYVHTNGNRTILQIGALIVQANFTAQGFESNNSNVRSLDTGSGVWSLTSQGSFPLACATLTNFTLTQNTPVRFTYSGGTGTRTVQYGNAAGGTEANAMSIAIVAGTDIFAITGSCVLKDVDYTGFTGTGTVAGSNFCGNLTLGSGMTANPSSSTINLFKSSGTQILTSNGVTCDTAITVNTGGATVRFADNWTFGSTRTMTLTAGILDFNDKNVTIGSFSSSNSNTRTLTLGSGTLALNGTGNFSTATATNLTVTATTGTIKFTDTSNTAVTFSGGGKTFGNVWFSRGASTGTITIVGSNTFLDFKDDGTAAHSIIFTAGTTQTVGTFNVNGNAGNLITINSNTTGTHTLTTSSIVSCDYLNIQHSIANGTGAWYAGLNSTNNQAVVTAGSGWTFDIPNGWVPRIICI